MMPLYEMMTRAQNGEAMQLMARQFGLSQAQVTQAMEALMPAFSAGLKRNVQNPMDMGQFLQALASGNHVQYFDDLRRAFTPAGAAEGNNILGHLFGSKDVSRAVAAQAEMVTGITETIYKQMLPAVAAAIMGGLFKQATGQMAGGGMGATDTATGKYGQAVSDIISEMMKGDFAAAGRRQMEAGQAALETPFGQAMKGMVDGAFGQPQTSRAAETKQPDFAEALNANPFMQAWRDMLTAGTQDSSSAGSAKSGAKTRKGSAAGDGQEGSASSAASPADIFGPMFEAGREVQRGYQKQIETIFDQYMKGMDPKR
ncbi:DUF937 domain-containing protein [Pseudohoeflea coraliihabitans]|uniref:DUF937 domain-containing protein n=1 Tax=Pseudohoeflea coraliihabitans TaxID=2860393 RepID=A0ABS6WN83_9HYPH|nr:DUF937 domain-containing protein [Pseudohoeflea sp. DP4N28-3]MBW3097128.1 DUF937 domain-containing protein [Pseudohoeflea sp. DP4N28-3]